MEMINKPAILIIALLILPLAGCNKGAATSNSDAKPATSNSNSGTNSATSGSSASAQANSNASSDNSATSNEPADPAKMLGTYQMVQVQKAGVVNMLSQARSEITFIPDGTYSRLSKVKDKVIHDDHGQYRIEGGQYLVLTIQISKKTIHNPPLEKRHKISLSSDGEELKMISENGDIAVFHKIRKT
jgi:hypothetical protein